jgi:hypothetical protein
MPLIALNWLQFKPALVEFTLVKQKSSKILGAFLDRLEQSTL